MITVFAVLCLIVFTLLTLSTVVASKNLAEASHNEVKAYYEADCEAERIFSQLRKGIIPDNVTVENNYYSYKCTISETQFIDVKISYIDGIWNVISWNNSTSAN